MSAARPLTHLIGAVVDPEWRTMQQLAEKGYFPTAVAARKFCTRHAQHLRLGRAGRALLVCQRSLNRYFETRALPGAERR